MDQQQVAHIRVMLRYLSDRLHHLLREQRLAYRLRIFLSVSTGRVILDTYTPASQLTKAFKVVQEVLDNYVQVLLAFYISVKSSFQNVLSLSMHNILRVLLNGTTLLLSQPRVQRSSTGLRRRRLCQVW